MKSNMDTLIKFYRPGTDDDRFIIPELVNYDMYRFKKVLSRFFKNKTGHVIDCGAQIGVFSKLCAKYLNSTIHAFEPQPDNFNLLKKNLDCENGNSLNTILHNKAVGLNNSKIRLYDEGGTGRFSCVPRNTNVSSIEIECIDLREYVKPLDSILIMKLDLEGYEATLINNAAEKLLKNVKVLIIEEHHEKINHNYIKKCGFKLWFYPATNLMNRVLTKTHFVKYRHFVYRKVT